MNPVAQIRQKSKFLRKTQTQKPIRRLSELQWSYVLGAAESLGRFRSLSSMKEHYVHHAGLICDVFTDISELVETDRWSPTMGDFERDLEGSWWFRTVGKGNKERQISVSDAMLNAALKRFRESRNLELPCPRLVNLPRLFIKPVARVASPVPARYEALCNSALMLPKARCKKKGLPKKLRSFLQLQSTGCVIPGISEDVKHQAPRTCARRCWPWFECYYRSLY